MKTLKKKNHNTIASTKKLNHTHRSPTISRASHHRISHLQQSRTVKTNHKTQLRTQNLRGTAVALYVRRYVHMRMQSVAMAMYVQLQAHAGHGVARRGGRSVCTPHDFFEINQFSKKSRI